MPLIKIDGKFVEFAVYPKMLYAADNKKYIVVNSEEEEGKAVKDGFAPYGVKRPKKTSVKKTTNKKAKG